MILQKAYGKSVVTAGAALLMAFAMVINQSLVARTFGSYTMQLFDAGDDTFWIPLLGVLLLIVAFLVNISGNKSVERSAVFMTILKVVGIAVFAIGGLWAAGYPFEQAVPANIPRDYNVPSYLGALAITMLAYAGFTTITNSGEEIKHPHKNIGRDIVIHWGMLTRLRKKVSANPIQLVLAIIFDVVILAAFLYMKIKTDLFVVILTLILMILIFSGEFIFLRKTGSGSNEHSEEGKKNSS